MKKGLVITLGVIVTLVLILIISIGTLWSHRNTAVALEEKIEAQYTANQSNYDNMWKKFIEMTQVTEIQAEQFKEAYTDLISGRYNDNKLLFKMVQEQNPQLDTSVYTQLQREISASRTTFDNNQKKITDIIREYNTHVRKHFIMAAITGKQPKNMSDYIVTSERTQDAFKNRKDDVINLKENQ